ncbi:hypothetical protein P3T37_001542 [Kitasatospora sp. MAA4]|uniref:hypothetical protein n=1 Tax=Kitasatospora sp. MAA4 TaxID=3035093 RepID=UPI0024751A8D|nr:hypothetical protein [Kitasatospora sp. MAA4]MDH6132157.1 hypothetical protein [Kitasatospora sp. MAA4]
MTHRNTTPISRLRAAGIAAGIAAALATGVVAALAGSATAAQQSSAYTRPPETTVGWNNTGA